MCAALMLGVVGFGCSEDEPSVSDDAPSADTDEASADTVATSPSEASNQSTSTRPGSTVVPPTSPAATAVEQPPIGIDTLPPVSLSDPAEVESGLEFTVVDVRDVEVDPVPSGGGDVAGPAVAVDIEVTNNGNADVDLNRFVITAAAAETELSRIGVAVDEPFFGLLAPGETASATYGFRTGGEPVTVLRLDDGLSRSIVIVEP